MTSESSVKRAAESKITSGADEQIVETAVEARQGYLGKRVLLILFVSLVLALTAGFFLLGSA